MIAMKSFILAVLCSLIIGCERFFDLGNGYTWKEAGVLSIITNKDNEVIIGPYSMELWAKYPWVYGYGKGEFLCFALNIKTGEILNWNEKKSQEFYIFTKKHELPTSLQKGENSFHSIYVTLLDITKGQYYNEGIATEFKKALTAH